MDGWWHRYIRIYRILALAAAYTLFAKSHAISYVIFILARLRRTTRKLGAITATAVALFALAFHWPKRNPFGWWWWRMEIAGNSKTNSQKTANRRRENKVARHDSLHSEICRLTEVSSLNRMMCMRVARIHCCAMNGKRQLTEESVHRNSRYTRNSTTIPRVTRHITMKPVRCRCHLITPNGRIEHRAYSRRAHRRYPLQRGERERRKHVRMQIIVHLDSIEKRARRVFYFYSSMRVSLPPRPPLLTIIIIISIAAREQFEKKPDQISRFFLYIFPSSFSLSFLCFVLVVRNTLLTKDVYTYFNKTNVHRRVENSTFPHPPCVQLITWE